MKPQKLTIRSRGAQSFSARCDIRPDINNKWHYHQELELVYIKKGQGTLYIGDGIESFEPGDVVLVGSNLPHFWQYHPCFFNHPEQYPVEVYVIHFNKDFWGSTFLALPENADLAQLFETSGRGLILKGRPAEKARAFIQSIPDAVGSKRLVSLLLALQAFTINVQFLASARFKAAVDKAQNDRLQLIYNYTIAHYHDKISIKAVAKVSNISEGSFCRFFKSQTGKTYVSFVTELRISNARRLLIENKHNLKTICAESGFKNPVSFYRAFKSTTGFTPIAFQKRLFV